MENEQLIKQIIDEGEALIRDKIKDNKNSSVGDIAYEVIDILIEKYNIKHIRDILYLEPVLYVYAAYCKEMLK